jgi:hypothetical protein
MNQPDQPVISPQAGIPDQKSRTHWPSVLQFVFSTLAIIGLWSIAFLLQSYRSGASPGDP